LVRAAGLVCPDLRLAGCFVSNACTFGACAILWKLARRDDADPRVADRTVLFFLLNPVGIFYVVPYSEGLFVLVLTGLAYFATQRQWLRAGACGYLLTLSRPVGIVAVALLGAEFLAPHLARLRGRQTVTRWPDAQAAAFLACLILTAGGVATYSAWLAFRFGDPLLFLHAASHWHHYLTTPWFTLLDPKFGIFYRCWFRCAVIVGLWLWGLGFVLKLRPSYLVMTGVYLLVYLSTAHLESIPRYLSVLFPFYLVAARLCIRWPVVEPVLLAGSTLLLAFSTILFANGYWFT
jgi:hypothetical protein